MNRFRRQTGLLVVFIGVAGLSTSAEVAAQPGSVDFARDIQPIFARRCYKCHGPTADEGGLRLNSREAALGELESGGFAIVPGDAQRSALLERVSTTDADLRMPPEGKPLTPAEIKNMKLWIEADAEWQAHWSFRPMNRPAIPQPADSKWIKNPIDAFILKRLEDKRLHPAPPADKIALLRRAYFDLIGLPPTPEQIAEFLADDSETAFETVIDNLLKSPQYGEKWARHWLDVVRYAETNGYERDSRKDLIWKYRDYVIRAFNEDKPFNRFVLEQLAGDEIENADGDSITATGFYRLGIWDDEPADRALARYDYLDDILRTTGEGFLGLTIGCARCHDHKIDPLSQRDYYSMLSFFSDISPHGKGKTNHVPITHAADKAQFAERQQAKQRREAELEKQNRGFQETFNQQLKQKYPKVAQPKQPLVPQNANVLLDSIKTGQEWEYTIKKPADNWFEIAFNKRKWKKGPAGFGTPGTPGAHVRTQWRSADIWLRKDFRLETIPGKIVLNIHHDEDAEVYVNGQLVISLKHYTTNYEQIDITERAVPILQTGRNTLAIHCRQTGGGQYIDAGLSVDNSKTPAFLLAQKFGLELLGQAKLDEWTRARQELNQSRSRELTLKTEFAMAVTESGKQQTWILGRGNPTMKGDEVQPAFPQILNPPTASLSETANNKSAGKRRVLAEWIASPQNPLTARVMVNRVWQHHFGRGLVRSTSDFGFQGVPPSHPQLLDWLATEFISDEWKLKSLHKLIMLSSTYQMSSQSDPNAYEQDPTNEFFWRYNMRRLTAEEIRDSILAVGGTQNLEMFGPSIYPPLPREVLATASRPSAAWGNSSPEQAARRSLYIHVKRSLRPPMLVNFDAPDADSSCAVRMSTTVPTQALGMLNSQFMQQQAEHFSQRLQREHPNDLDQQITLASHLTTGRAPSPADLQADKKFLSDLEQKEKLSPAVALRYYCLLILNTNEFVYLD